MFFSLSSSFTPLASCVVTFIKAGLDAKETLETSESLSKHSSIQQQGNLELYDLKHLEERHKLLSHPLLKLWIDEVRSGRPAMENVFGPQFGSFDSFGL